MFLAVGFPGVDTNGGVRVGDVAVAVPNGVHLVEGLFVGGAVAPNLFANVFDAIAAKVEKAREIVGIAHVHGVGIGGDGGTRNIVSRQKILRDADALGENAGGEIAEIAAGYGDNKWNGSDRQLAVGGDVIEHLREQTANVDGIRGGEKGALIEWFVGKGLLDETLAIVKGAGDFNSGDVLAECGELFFLGFADALGRIKNDNANAGDAEKTVSDGAAGVAGSSDENGELAGLAANEIAHEAGHEARAKILERESGSVKKFEDVKRR